MDTKKIVKNSKDAVKDMFNTLRRPIAAGIHAIDRAAEDIPSTDNCTEDKYPF